MSCLAVTDNCKNREIIRNVLLMVEISIKVICEKVKFSNRGFCYNLSDYE